MRRFDDVLACEARSHASGGRVTSVVVWRGDSYTLACVGDWGLARALIRAVLP